MNDPAAPSLADGDGTYADVIAKQLRALGFHSAADHVLALDATVAMLNEDRFQAETAREDAEAGLWSLAEAQAAWQRTNKSLRERLAAAEAVAKRFRDGWAPEHSEVGRRWWWASGQPHAMSDAECQVLDRLNERDGSSE